MKLLTDGAQNQLLVQGSEAHALQLKKQSNELIRIAIESLKDIDPIIKLEQSLTIEKAIQTGLPLHYHLRENGRAVLLVALDAQISRLSASINVKHNLTSMQIKQLCNDILEMYPHETLEDFLIIFKRARQGYYKNEQGKAEIYKLDQSTIFGWISQHLEEKSIVLEQIRKQEEEDRNKNISQLTNEGLKELYEKAFNGELSESEPALTPRRNSMGFDDSKYQEYKTEYIRRKMLTEIKQQKENGEIISRAEEPQRRGIDETNPTDEQTL